MPTWLRWAKRLGASVVVGYGVVIVALFCCQRLLVYPRPVPRRFQLPEDATVQTVEFPGGTVPMVVRRVPDRPVVVFFHGNHAQMTQSVRQDKAVRSHNLGFAAIEYPGYGMATGQGPTETSVLAAARAGLDALGNDDPVVCVGHSLGTGVAAAMAAENRCARLVLLAPYTSLPDAAHAQYPFVPTSWLMLDHFDTSARVGDIHVPTLIVHGTRDRVIPNRMGAALADAISGARLISRETDHNGVVDEETWRDVAAFVDG